MGMNYYLKVDVCDHCKRAKQTLHIGKSSAGWCFSLNTHPYEGLTDLSRWVAKWSQAGNLIEDEYGRPISPEEMVEVITKRSFPGGLLRHTVDGRHCIGHGHGTFDLMLGEFC